MKVEIRQRDRRALVLLGMGVAVFLITDHVLFPAYDWLAQAPEAAVQKEDVLERYRQAVARQGSTVGVIEAVEEATEQLRGRLVVADSANAAAVRLQSVLETAAEDVGIVIAQRNASQSREIAEGAYREMSMGLNFQALPAELAEFLVRLRADDTYLKITRLQISPMDLSTEVPEDGILGRGLQVTMTVVAISSIDPAPTRAPEASL